VFLVGGSIASYTGASDAPVPEPSSLILLGSAVLVLWGFRHRRATRNAPPPFLKDRARHSS
jgi:hypothetical protein